MEEACNEIIDEMKKIEEDSEQIDCYAIIDLINDNIKCVNVFPEVLGNLITFLGPESGMISQNGNLHQIHQISRFFPTMWKTMCFLSQIFLQVPHLCGDYVRSERIVTGLRWPRT